MISCLILVAGIGSRLKHITKNTPKSLVKLINKPILEYQLNTLRKCGIENIALVTGYESQKFNRYNLKSFHNKFYYETNMVESIFVARPFLSGLQGDLIISYGDIVYQKNNLDKLIKTKGDISIMIDEDWIKLWSLRNANPLNDAETLKYDAKGNIAELGKKPKDLTEINGQYTGLIKINHKKINDFIKFYDDMNHDAQYNNKPFKMLYLTDFLQYLINNNWEITPSKVNNGWLEIDTVEDLFLYEKLFYEKKLNDLWDDQK